MSHASASRGKKVPCRLCGLNLARRDLARPRPQSRCGRGGETARRFSRHAHTARAILPRARGRERARGGINQRFSVTLVSFRLVHRDARDSTKRATTTTTTTTTKRDENIPSPTGHYPVYATVNVDLLTNECRKTVRTDTDARVDRDTRLKLTFSHSCVFSEQSDGQRTQRSRDRNHSRIRAREHVRIYRSTV